MPSGTLVPALGTLRRGQKNISRRASSSIRATLPACSTWATSKSGREIRQPPNDSFSRPCSSNPNFSEALLELANLRIADKKFEEAAILLRRYVKVSRDPASGYYKLAMVERSLHQTEAAQRDLNVVPDCSRKILHRVPYPYQHLFEYLDNRSNLAPQARTQLDESELTGTDPEASGSSARSLSAGGDLSETRKAGRCSKHNRAA